MKSNSHTQAYEQEDDRPTNSCIELVPPPPPPPLLLLTSESCMKWRRGDGRMGLHKGRECVTDSTDFRFRSQFDITPPSTGHAHTTHHVTLNLSHTTNTDLLRQ
jgi:hypothetical protein